MNEDGEGSKLIRLDQAWLIEHRRKWAAERELRAMYPGPNGMEIHEEIEARDAGWKGPAGGLPARGLRDELTRQLDRKIKLKSLTLLTLVCSHNSTLGTVVRLAGARWLMSTPRALDVEVRDHELYPSQIRDELGADAPESLEFDEVETEGGHVVEVHHVVIARDVRTIKFVRKLPTFDWIDSPVEWDATLASVCCVRSIRSSKARELLERASTRRVVI